MARLEIGVDVTVEGAAKLDKLGSEISGTSDELDELADSLDKAAVHARDMADDLDNAAGSLDFSRASGAAETLENSGEGIRNFANGAVDSFNAVSDSSLSLQERIALGAGGIADVANGMRNAIIPAFQAIANGALTSAISMAQSVARQIAAWALLGVQSLLNAAKVAAAWLIAMGPIALIVAAVIALVAAIVLNWDKIVAFIRGAVARMGEIIGGFVKFFRDAWDGMLRFLGDIGRSIAEFGAKLWKPIGDGFKAAIDFIKGVWNAFVGFWNSIEVSVPSFDIPFVGKVGGFTIGLPDLPHLAQGGIVDRPTLAVIGEHGPEAVVPLGQGGFNTGTVIEVNVLGDLRAEDEQSVADAIGRVLWVTNMNDSALIGS